MAVKNITPSLLDEILEKMVNHVSDSKREIVEIGEQCRIEFYHTLEEINKVKYTISNLINESERLEKEVYIARKRLSEVSMHINTYSEEEIRIAFENAHNFQMKLTLNQQLEKQLLEKRDELERRLQSLECTITRADNLVSQVTIVLNYLSEDLNHVSEFIKNAEEKQQFGLKIIEAQEEERKKLSREIHDGPAQMLANVMMQTDLIERIYDAQGIEAALREIKLLKKTVRDALYEVRYIIYDLRPMALDDLGLLPTLKKYLQTVEEYSQSATISFVFSGEKRRLDRKMEVALFRLIQESVQNALKHAEANKILVELALTSNEVTVRVKDDGKGFDPDVKKEDSFGLRGMKERVELLEGHIKIESTKGNGTDIEIVVPFI